MKTSLSREREERLRGVTDLGYTPREAAFLETAALHSGWFLTRQYETFARVGRGRAAASLIRKLLDRRHARSTELVGTARLYHLYARPFYRAVGAENDRNRRKRSISAVRSRVMTLDLVLDLKAECPELRPLPRERDKVAHLEDLGVALEDMPRRVYGSGGRTLVRRFVDKSPVFAAPEGRPVFAFVPSEALSFRRRLAEHRRLFRALERLCGFTLVYASEGPLDEDRLRADFESVLGPSPVRERRRLERLLRDRSYERLNKRDLDRLRELRRLGPESEDDGRTSRILFRRLEASYAAFGRLD